MERRGSKPERGQSTGALFKSESEKADLEARNGLLQYDEAMALLEQNLKAGHFVLRPSLVQKMHRIAIKDIYSCAGTYRTCPVRIWNSNHTPPGFEEIPELMEEMCDYASQEDRDAIHTASYLMWRINWIHPFMGGNGRTSRIISYLSLCSKLELRIPGSLTIPDQIVDSPGTYYHCLDAADEAYREKGRVDVTEMEQMINRLLERQILS